MLELMGSVILIGYTPQNMEESFLNIKNEFRTLEKIHKIKEQKEKEKNKKPPELGSADDFMLSQAVAFINGQPVKRSSSKLE